MLPHTIIIHPTATLWYLPYHAWQHVVIHEFLSSLGSFIESCAVAKMSLSAWTSQYQLSKLQPPLQDGKLQHWIITCNWHLPCIQCSQLTKMTDATKHMHGIQDFTSSIETKKQQKYNQDAFGTELTCKRFLVGSC